MTVNDLMLLLRKNKIKVAAMILAIAIFPSLYDDWSASRSAEKLKSDRDEVGTQASIAGMMLFNAWKSCTQIGISDISTRVFDNGHTVEGHASLTPVLLFDALKIFEAPHDPEQGADAACAQSLRQGALAELARIRQLDAEGNRAGALNALVEFDYAYGRLLPDEEIALAKQLKPEFFGTSTEPAAQSTN